jgi:hypothetical protein
MAASSSLTLLELGWAGWRMNSGRIVYYSTCMWSLQPLCVAWASLKHGNLQGVKHLTSSQDSLKTWLQISSKFDIRFYCLWFFTFSWHASVLPLVKHPHCEASRCFIIFMAIIIELRKVYSFNPVDLWTLSLFALGFVGNFPHRLFMLRVILEFLCKPHTESEWNHFRTSP